MAVIGGSEGTVTWEDKYTTNVYEWRGSIDFDIHYFLTFASADAYGSIQGAYKFTGELMCYLDDVTAASVFDAGTAATALALIATPGTSTNAEYACNAHLSRLAPAVSAQTGPNTIAVGFVADGAVTITGKADL